MGSSSRVQAVVLGSAQDGGVPQANCRCARCEHARRDPRARRLPSCLAVADLDIGTCVLVDATPALGEQLDLALACGFPVREGRNPVDGVLLTHAHVGHCLGLLGFGREVLASQELPVHCTQRMGRFLSDNEPWARLVAESSVRLSLLEPERTLELSPHLSVTPLRVPHRDELSDTVAFVFEGPSRRLLWLPDIDSWDAWDRELADVVHGVDVAFLDATFHSAAELPGRDLSRVPHPLVEDTMARLSDGEGRKACDAEVFLVHLNHTNAILGPDPVARAESESRGFSIAREGQVVVL